MSVARNTLMLQTKTLTRIHTMQNNTYVKALKVKLITHGVTLT